MEKVYMPKLTKRTQAGLVGLLLVLISTFQLLSIN